ncbi:hypothetical protein Bca52824_060594 [Brassica carinata]|uniref:Uncharacterized protein n=1 Tax=Brassica carinata TaxID=52824 RepID=A0A8X7UGV3_BRACI|nr:hypothetical protein Bca52824_060594 [Brassica carinata]
MPKSSHEAPLTTLMPPPSAVGSTLSSQTRATTLLLSPTIKVGLQAKLFGKHTAPRDRGSRVRGGNVADAAAEKPDDYVVATEESHTAGSFEVSFGTGLNRKTTEIDKRYFRPTERLTI